MAAYWLVSNGVIAQSFATPPGFAITDCFAPGVTCAPQDATPGVAPGWTATEAFGAWSFTPPPAAPAPTAQQVAQAAYGALIAAGLNLTSTGTPALNGIFPIDAQAQSDIATESQFISTFTEFTNGGTIGLPWQQLSGAVVTFPTTAAFLAFAKATGQTVAAAKLAVVQGSAMPSAAVTIA